MPEPKTKRLFAAIKIQASEDFCKIYHQIKLALMHDYITWVQTENMHLTLKFFGETPVDEIPAIDQCLKLASGGIKSFDIRIRQTDIFGSVYDPRVIWFGLEAGSSLQGLYHSISEHLKTVGIFPDRQNYVPHLTIGRIKKIADKRLFQQIVDQFKNCDLGKQKISELVLYESILRHEGPSYNALHRYTFKA
ncbi:MAG: RNA 2',3'-cyclic phosphodiesterase [Bacteroidales bacterium]|nr:RNA 2',3'-cyclic phosphodiesterase [Bacteroidales bacterium]